VVLFLLNLTVTYYVCMYVCMYQCMHVCMCVFLGLDQGVIRRAKLRVLNAREWTTITGKYRHTGHVSSLHSDYGQMIRQNLAMGLS